VAVSIEFSVTHRYASDEDAITVPVTLRAGTSSVDVAAKVDTGAAFCIFERRFGEVIGLDIEAGRLQRFRTATGSFNAYEHQVEIRTFKIEFSSIVYFAEDPEFGVNVLGRKGWLDRLRVGIVDHDQILYLNTYDS
jgi:hypothetical protein